jgi:hypothetical protein
LFEIQLNRLDIDEIKAQSELVSKYPNLNYFLDKVPDIILIINEQRQIVYCNSNLLLYLGIESKTDVYGKRPREILICEHAFENDEGCSTTKFCKLCGAFKAIETSLNKDKDIQECRIIQKDTGSALDLRVWTSPIDINGKNFIMFSLADIADEKRKELLERTFFHDILNTAIGVKAIVDIVEEDFQDRFGEYSILMKNTVSRLLEEINSQKQLVEAEHLTLALNLQEFKTLVLMKELVTFVKNYSFAQGVSINIDDGFEDISIIKDKALLGRVLSNLLKNAIEAEFPNGVVNVGCKLVNDEVQFWIQNNSIMPEDVQLQLFRRSFSTKGTGRGIGTYSVKLLTERYLQGRVSFISEESTGTIFNLYIPFKLEKPELI